MCIAPETLLALARRNQVNLPSDTVKGLRQWYAFTDFSHFIEVLPHLMSMYPYPRGY